MRLPTASSLKRAAACPGSFALPWVNESNQHSDKGNFVHKFRENCKLYGRDKALEMCDSSVRSLCEAIDMDWLNLGSMAVEVAFAYSPEFGRAEEVGRSIERGYPKMEGYIFGTADLVAVGPDRVYVGDYKTGGGHDSYSPPPARNPQLKFLALAACRAYEKNGADLEIIRIKDNGATWGERASMDAFELDDFETSLKATVKAVKAAQESKDPVVVTPGDHCKYCPAMSSCPAKTSLLRQVCREGEEAILRDSVELTKDIVPAVWQRIEEVEAVLKKVKGQVEEYAKHNPVPFPDGRILALKEDERRKLDGVTTHAVLSSKYGHELADAAVEWSATQAGIERALRPYAKEKGAKIGALKAEVMADLEEAGAVSVNKWSRVSLFKPKSEGSDAETIDV